MEGLKCKNGKRSQKWIFLVLAKHGLNKHEIRPNIWSPNREKTVEREGEKRRREEEEEEEEEKKKKRRKRRRSSKLRSKVWNYMAFKALNGFPCNCMVISCLKPRVFLGFHPNPIIIESKVDRTIKSTRSI